MRAVYKLVSQSTRAGTCVPAEEGIVAFLEDPRTSTVRDLSFMARNEQKHLILDVTEMLLYVHT